MPYRPSRPRSCRIFAKSIWYGGLSYKECLIDHHHYHHPLIIPLIIIIINIIINQNVTLLAKPLDIITNVRTTEGYISNTTGDWPIPTRIEQWERFTRAGLYFDYADFLDADISPDEVDLVLPSILTYMFNGDTVVGLVNKILAKADLFLSAGRKALGRHIGILGGSAVQLNSVCIQAGIIVFADLN